jgi:hypothetical protein
MRIVKVKNFNPQIWGLTENEVNCIRATAFQIKGNKLIVLGSKSDIKEITNYFDAHVLKIHAASEEEVDINFDDHYKVDEIEIDLAQFLEQLEEEQVVEDIKKLRIKSMEVTLGRIDNCIVRTHDYGGARQEVSKDDTLTFGIEIRLKQPENTLIYVDQDGQVRVSAPGDADVNLEELAFGFIDRL